MRKLGASPSATDIETAKMCCEYLQRPNSVKSRETQDERVDLHAAEGRPWSVCLMHTREGQEASRRDYATSHM